MSTLQSLHANTHRYAADVQSWHRKEKKILLERNLWHQIISWHFYLPFFLRVFYFISIDSAWCGADISQLKDKLLSHTEGNNDYSSRPTPSFYILLPRIYYIKNCNKCFKTKFLASDLLTFVMTPELNQELNHKKKTRLKKTIDGFQLPCFGQ